MESEKMHIRHVMLWKFKQGNSAKATAEKICNTTLKDELRAGHPSDFDDNLLKKLGKINKLGVWIPHNLSERNKEDRMSIATSLLSRVKIEPFLNRIITGDEKWVTYDQYRP
ncbi:hypothetical protein ACFW04_004619 [Cataglyphis niger]